MRVIVKFQVDLAEVIKNTRCLGDLKIDFDT